MSDKKYGLIVSSKSKPAPVFQATRNIFGQDSDSDEETNKKSALKLRPSDIVNRQSKINQEKAVLEDPTVYQYDEIYDKMVGEKEKEKQKVKAEKKPKYIENLLKTATKRKIENERRIERQIQKEREKEGEEFKDKEVFVTTAYKKKLEEMRVEEEKEKREEYLENIGDVTKQKDLGGFYRHLYEQRLGSDKSKTEALKSPQKENKDKADLPNLKEKPSTDQSKKRNYRKRKSSDARKDLSDGEIEDTDEEINRHNLEDIRIAKKSKPNEENIDADSDFSIDDPSDEETSNKTEAKENTPDLFVKPISKKSPEAKKNLPKTVEPNKAEEKVVEQEKIDIWKKRTVGVLFEDALQRYYERKAARG